MRCFLLILLLVGCTRMQAQAGSTPAESSTSRTQDSSPPKPATSRTPNLAPPRSDRVDADSLPDDGGSSSSKDTQIDLSGPVDDEKAHPKSSDILMDEANSPENSIGEMHPWDPHKSAKDVEVGDYYFKRKNYVAAESRYREALYYKDNDALATYRLAVCLEKLDRLDEARTQFQTYLNILPHGPQAEDAKQGIERLKKLQTADKTAK